MNASRAYRQVARKNRNAVVQNVDVGDFVADVHQADSAAHCGGIVDLKCVVQRKGVYVHRAWRDSRLRKNAELRLDEIALGSNEEDAHFVPAVAIAVENLKI